MSDKGSGRDRKRALDRRRRRARVGQWIARLLCVLFAVVGGLPLLVAMLVRTDFVRARAAEQAQALLRDELGVEATFEAVVQPWPLALTLNNLVLKSSDGGDPALQADLITIHPRLFSLLQGRINAGDIEIDRPRIRLVIRDGKLVNLALRESGEPAQKRSDEAPFSSIAVNAASIDLTMDGTRVRGGEIDLDLSAQAGRSFDIALRTGVVDIDRSSPLSFKGYGAPEPVDNALHEDRICQLDARVHVSPGAVLARRFRMHGGADLNPAPGTRPPCALAMEDPRRVEVELRLAKVAMDDAGLSAVSGQARARAPARLVNRFLAFPALTGWIEADVTHAWQRGQKLPKVSGTVRGRQLALGIYRLASTLSAQVAVEGGVVRVPSARVGFADGMVQIQGLEVEPLEEGVPLRARQVDIEGLQFPGLMRDLGVTDHTHVRMAFDDGRFTKVEGKLDPVHIDSQLVTHVRGFEVFDSAFDDPARQHVIGVDKATVHAKFAVRPNAVEFQNARAEFGQSHLNVFTSLGFANEFRLAVSEGSSLHLQDVSPLVDIPWKGDARLTAQITGVFNDPVIEGSVAINGFEFADMALGDLHEAQVAFRPMVMELSEVRGTKGRSPYRVPWMRLDFTGPAPIVADASIQTSGFDVRDFLSIFQFDEDPRFTDIHGSASADATLHYELGGPLDRCGSGWLGVRARGSIAKAELFEERYDSGAFDIDYEWFDRAAQELGTRVDIRSFMLRKGRGTIVGKGSVAPGGVLRARAAVTGLPLGELQSLGTLGPLLDATVDATADVRGTLDRIEADVDARVSQLRLGATTLPSSRVAVKLVPVDPPVRVTGRSACGLPISAPFDPADYAKDRPQGVFEVRGDFFGGQVVVQDLQVTRQESKVVTGMVVARGLDIGKVAQLVPAVASSEQPPAGILSGALELRSLELDNMRRADLSLVLTALDLQSNDGIVHLREGTPAITLRNDELTVPGVLLDFTSRQGLTGTFVAGGAIHRVASDPELELYARLLPTDLSSLANMVPRIERARGTVQATLDITGKPSSPSYQGEVSLTDGSLTLRGFPLPIEEANVEVRLAEREIRLERATARLGGGRIQAVGTLPVRGFDFGTATASISARDLSLPLVDGVAMTADADLTATWTARIDEAERSIPRVVGDVTLTSFEYTRPFKIEADINTLAQRVRKTEFELYDPKRDVVDFEVRLLAQRPLRIRNNLVDMQLMLDTPSLILSGSNQRVGLRGALRVKQGSRVRLRNNEFEVRDGVVRFDDPHQIAPVVDVTAVTEYRRYQAASPTAAGAASGGGATGVSRAGGQWRIQLHAHGDAENLRLDLTSEPALSQEDIVLLLTLGVTRAELDQMQASALGETAALEALSTLTGADSAVRETIPVIDDFRFGSAYSSRSGSTEPTVTVGKRVTDRVRANVTSGLTESREVRSALEWELTGTTSLLGSYDNVNNVSNSAVGNVGADIRFRITFE